MTHRFYEKTMGNVLTPIEWHEAVSKAIREGELVIDREGYIKPKRTSFFLFGLFKRMWERIKVLVWWRNSTCVDLK